MLGSVAAWQAAVTLQWRGRHVPRQYAIRPSIRSSLMCVQLAPPRLLMLTHRCSASAEHHGRLPGRRTAHCDTVVARATCLAAPHEQHALDSAAAVRVPTAAMCDGWLAAAARVLLVTTTSKPAMSWPGPRHAARIRKRALTRCVCIWLCGPATPAWAIGRDRESAVARRAA